MTNLYISFPFHIAMVQSPQAPGQAEDNLQQTELVDQLTHGYESTKPVLLGGFNLLEQRQSR